MNLYLTLFLCFTSVTAVPSSPHRIVGGSVVTIEQYPSIAALLYSSNLITYQQACGGTILTTRAVLTAAHCSDGDTINRWRVRVGSTYANSGGVVYTLALIIYHPNYNSRTFDSDIAIMRTATAITYGTTVQPASIAGPNYKLADNQALWAAGWGTTSVNGQVSEQLRHVQIWSVNQTICAQRYAIIASSVTANMLCSGWLDVGGRDQCQGDSGGPLYHNDVLVGVCSWGEQCGLAFYPGVNVRISRFSLWIQVNT